VSQGDAEGPQRGAHEGHDLQTAGRLPEQVRRQPSRAAGRSLESARAVPQRATEPSAAGRFAARLR
jgi:hypothetical protein